YYAETSHWTEVDCLSYRSDDSRDPRRLNSRHKDDNKNEIYNIEERMYVLEGSVKKNNYGKCVRKFAHKFPDIRISYKVLRFEVDEKVAYNGFSL
ncbi:hypothetical protein ANN_19894, partial [Periplaneta americana]